MSNDSSQPDHDPAKIDPRAAKQSKEGTETDLWDLEFDGTGSTDPAVASAGESSGLPSRRTSESSVSSTKPSERKIIPQNFTQTETAEPEPSQYEALEEAEPKKPTITQAPLASEKPDANDKEWDSSGDEMEGSRESSMRPALAATASFTKIEKIAVSGLFAALAVGAALALIHFSNEVPTRPAITEEIDFPINGQLIEIKAATTYWREPVTTGEDADVVKRGTKLIPVLKLSLNAKPCSVRIFFRNEDGTVIGDAITRIVSGDTELTIPATAGFDDIGMHAAYRTGGSEPWVIQILEGPDGAASMEKFKTVLETEISSDMR